MASLTWQYARNAALVAKARHIIEELGGEIATVDQARELLELPARR